MSIDIARSPQLAEMSIDIALSPQLAEMTIDIARSPHLAEMSIDIARSPRLAEMSMEHVKEYCDTSRWVSNFWSYVTKLKHSNFRKINFNKTRLQ